MRQFLLLLTLTTPLLTAAQTVPDLSKLPPCLQACVPLALEAAKDCATLKDTALLTCICYGANGSKFSDSLIDCITKGCGTDANAILLQAGSFCDGVPAAGGVISTASTGNTGGTSVSGGMTGGTTTEGNISRGEPTGSSMPPSETSSVMSRGEPPVSSQAGTSAAGGGTTRAVSEPTTTGSASGAGTTSTGAAVAGIVVPGAVGWGVGVLGLVAAMF
ncbi:hypothetical protein TWF281_002274 [Arthrobotrys megalospora]